VTAWCKDDATRRRVRAISRQIPQRLFHNYKGWAGWEVLWEGKTYQLRDLAENDVEQLSTLLQDAVRETFEPISKALSSC